MDFEKLVSFSLPRFSMILGAMFLLFSFATYGQDDAEEDEDESEEVTEEEVVETETDSAQETASAAGQEIEEVVVTGSRLKRSTFTSISPLQIIDAEVSREAGLVDSEEILQKSVQASGNQIDSTYVGYVLDNGPGAATVDLRGLSADRTLLLINGRRVAPAGVGGAPSSPDAGLVPGILVQDYELLLDGASSIYGSDAIAGVGNIILRKDFEGLEVSAYGTDYQYANDTKYSNLAVTWGRNYDRGFIGVAGARSHFPHITLEEADNLRPCTPHAEVDENGVIRTRGLYYNNLYGTDFGECRYEGLRNIVWGSHRGGTIYHTPGRSNGGWPNFSELNFYHPATGVLFNDADGDGLNDDVNFADYNTNGKDGFSTLYPERTRTHYMAYGEYTFEGDWNFTPSFEILHSRRQSHSIGTLWAIWAGIHPLNPYNICNPFGNNGVDCGLAYDEYLLNPTTTQNLIDAAGCDPRAGCLRGGPAGPRPLGIQFHVQGDRNTSDVVVRQTRYVVATEMDLPFMNRGGFSGWSMEVSVTHSSSQGVERRMGIRDDKWNLALGNYSIDGIPCDITPGYKHQFGTSVPDLEPDTAAGCVPVNMFAPSLWQPSLVGNFATQRERDYLFDLRYFDTRYNQTIYSAFATGSAYSLPAGAINAGVGVEVRRDWIASLPNRVAGDGLFFGFSVDEGAEGRKTTEELFAEAEFPLLGNQTLAEELTLNVSGRLTSDEYYGSHTTYSTKMAYRPITSLLLRATKGTSYRSPNLRNLFLKGQTGFNNVFDPCLIPSAALDEETGEYIASEDLREAHVLTNCRNNGVDPLVAHNEGRNFYNTEIRLGGSLSLDPETSESESLGFVFEQPFTNAFLLTVGMSYYSIDVDDTIVEPSNQFIINDCYYSQTGTSTFCNRISRADDPTSPLITLLDAGQLNRDNETVRGFDYNIRFADTWTIFDRPYQVDVDVNSHRLLERSTLFVNDEGVSDADEFRSEWGYHRFKHDIRVGVGFSDFLVRWSISGLSPLQQDLRGIDDFGTAEDGSANTCMGPPDDVLCRDVGFADRYYLHSLSLTYRSPDGVMLIRAGSRNILNEKPPLVDDTEVWSLRGVPYGGFGYDLLGRTVFVNFAYTFGQL